LMPFTASASGIVNAKIDSAAWMEQIANHAKMAIKQDLRSVEIKLTPAHLGTIEILVAQDDESTQLAFFTKHAHVRDALESQLARLQKFFQEDGLELSDAWVSDQSLAEHRERQSAAEHGDEWPGGTLADGTSAQETLSATADQRQKPDPDRQLDVWA
jgi:flagellar hook-length control protein FliK